VDATAGEAGMPSPSIVHWNRTTTAVGGFVSSSAEKYPQNSWEATGAPR
jgi:hypothetical protein